MKWFDAIMCALGKCRRCRIYSTDAGIGGKCESCCRIYGWVTRDELQSYSRALDAEDGQ